MKFLYNSKGRHIANLIENRLHAPDGQHIGLFDEQHGIFIDLFGHYIGELMYDDRLMCYEYSPHHHEKYVVADKYAEVSNAGNYGDPGTNSDIGSIKDYHDIETPWL